MMNAVVSPSSFKLIEDYLYPYARGYNGYIERCTFTFSLGPEQIPSTDWARQKAIGAFEEEMRNNGHEMISLQIWEDIAPTWTTDYKVVARSTSSPGLPWLLIIGAVFVLIFIFAVTFVIKAITRLWYGDPASGTPGLGSILSSIIPLMIVVMMMAVIMPMMSGAMGTPKEAPPAPKLLPERTAR